MKEINVALLGNPNVGKSTVFNVLTGLHQHTGNWPGKTVDLAIGKFEHQDKIINIVDLPGTYSMLAHSGEEEVTRDYICLKAPDVVVVVCNATCLERNMNILLQAMEITDNVVVCINMIDEAKEKGIHIDRDRLASILGVPVVLVSAREEVGIHELKSEIAGFKPLQKVFKLMYSSKLETAAQDIIEHLPWETIVMRRWLAFRLLEGDESIYSTLNISPKPVEEIEELLASIDKESAGEEIMQTILSKGQSICEECVSFTKANYNQRDRRLDKIFTGRWTAAPIMLLLLALVFWITISGANYPSRLLSELFGKMQLGLGNLFTKLQVSPIVTGIVVDGIFSVLSWVVSVMLPPMAIFFPLFALLEDSGYLPRIAFNMDRYFKRCSACGKNSLTMCLGLGCNAVGVMGCRIIDSPRERIMAIITNNFMPCNGRFPTMIAIISMFLVGGVSGFFKGIAASMVLIGVILFGVTLTLASSYLLSKTLLKGVPSSFVLEMPSYRKPKVMQVLIRSFMDKTLKVLWRAIIVAAPVGAVLWIFANTHIGNVSILNHLTNFMDPIARIFGMDGVILTAFILGMPANEIVIPIALMAYMSKGTMVPFENMSAVHNLLVANGWTLATAVCTILFSLMHWPCATTLLTIKKETGSIKWTALAFLLPTICGLIVCFIVNFVMKIYM